MGKRLRDLKKMGVGRSKPEKPTVAMLIVLIGIALLVIGVVLFVIRTS